MIFRPELAAAVLRGDKTQTRRLVRPGEEACAYRAGGSYSVQPGRGRKAVGRIVVTHVERRRLGEITHEDAVAEGFASVEAFARYWLDLHDASYRGALEHATDEEALERFHQRHGRAEVWAIRFVLDPTASPRLLHRHSERGYTASPRDALPDEPEAVDHWAQVAITREANLRDDERRRRQAEIDMRRQLERIEAELERAGRIASRWGVDLRDRLRVASRAVIAADRDFASRVAGRDRP